jgi:CRP-like cAMP-binding protein
LPGKNTERPREGVREELIQALSHSALLQELGRETADSPRLRQMLGTSEVVQFRRGRVIFYEGYPSDRMYFLIEGMVEVSRSGKAICTLARTGEVFGELGAITGEKRSATVTAVDNVTCLAMRPARSVNTDNSDHEVFMRTLRIAMTNLLRGRLGATNRELASVRQELERALKQIELLERNQARLEQENERLREEIKKHLRWPHRHH